MIERPKDYGWGNGDYLNLLEPILKDLKPKCLLEFGIGEGSLKLRKFCERLVSVELLHYPQHQGWFEYIQSLFKDDPNWKGYLHYCKEDKWEKGVREFISTLLKVEKPDFIFVDPGVHFRPEIVNYCQTKKVANISVHDTARGEKDYHWSRLKTKKDYQMIKADEGQGTIYWTRKDTLK